MSKRARHSATYTFVSPNASGDGVADARLLAFCGVDVPRGFGLVLLARDKQVMFGALESRESRESLQSLHSLHSPRRRAWSATLREIRESAELAVAALEAREAREPLEPRGVYRVYLVRAGVAFTIPLALVDGGLEPAVCPRGARLRVDDAVLVPSSCVTVRALVRLGRCVALFRPFGMYEPATPLPLAGLVCVLRELRKAKTAIPIVVTRELAGFLRVVERAVPGTTRRVLTDPYAPLVNVGLLLGELAGVISASILGAAERYAIRAPCNWPCVVARGYGGGLAPHPASPDGTFSVFAAPGELLGMRGVRLMYAADGARCADGAFRVPFRDPLTGSRASLEEDPRSPVIFVDGPAGPLDGPVPSAPAAPLLGCFADHGDSRVLATFRTMFRPCADAAVISALNGTQGGQDPEPCAAGVHLRVAAAFARFAGEQIAGLPVVETVAVELDPTSCAVSVALLLRLLRVRACVLCGEPNKIAYVVRLLVKGFEPRDGLGFTCHVPGTLDGTVDVHLSALNAIPSLALSLAIRPRARANVGALSSVAHVILSAMRACPKRALYVCLSGFPSPRELPLTAETQMYAAVISDLASRVYRSAKTDWPSTLRLSPEFALALPAVERSVFPLIEMVRNGGARAKRVLARAADHAAAGHFALGLPMRELVALVAERGAPAVPTDAPLPSACSLCRTFRAAEDDARAVVVAGACASCVAASLRALRLIGETDALASKCSTRNARALLELSDSWARAAAIAEVADAEADARLARAHLELGSLFSSIHLASPASAANVVELGRVVPDIALAERAPYVCGLLFAQAPDDAHVLYRLGLGRFFSG